MNKWTINEDGYAMWCYHFPSKELINRGFYFDTVIDRFIDIGDETKLFRLNKSGGEFHDCLRKEFIKYYNEKRNGSKFYPNINSAYLSDDLKEEDMEFYFSSCHYLYNIKDEITEFEMSYKSVRSIMEEVGHPYNKKGIVPLIHFKTGRTINKDLEVLENDICFYLNSDLWLEKVPCGHCNKKYNNEDLRNSGSLSNIKNFWHDNRELANRNITILNQFMRSMLITVQDLGGSIEFNKGGMSLYEGYLNEEGIKS